MNRHQGEKEDNLPVADFLVYGPYYLSYLLDGSEYAVILYISMRNSTGSLLQQLVANQLL